jgi:2-keto-4-pentenoate hydratase/2-oxohepta-3-ene-1,7-dioic acid hydratase in catechol pathway
VDYEGEAAGVGIARGVYLAAGDEVCIEVEVVGELRNQVAAPRP